MQILMASLLFRNEMTDSILLFANPLEFSSSAFLFFLVEFDEIGGSRMQITIPAGTQSRSQLRLKSKGMNIRGSTIRGNAFLEVVVKIPTLTEEDKTKTIIDLQGKI